MNQFFYEQRGKEKIKDLQAEGLRSQAFHRSGAPRLSMFQGLQQLILGILGRRPSKQGHSMQSPKADLNLTPTNQRE
jgi:hypothetical protein